MPLHEHQDHGAVRTLSFMHSSSLQETGRCNTNFYMIALCLQPSAAGGSRIWMLLAAILAGASSFGFIWCDFLCSSGGLISSLSNTYTAFNEHPTNAELSFVQTKKRVIEVGGLASHTSLCEADAHISRQRVDGLFLCQINCLRLAKHRCNHKHRN